MLELTVILLLRGGEDRAKQEEKARDVQAAGVKIGFLSRLHAKVYISESQAIVTSMNLLKSSALDSWELAIRAHAREDLALFKDIIHHTQGLVDRAKDERELDAKLNAGRGAASLAALVAASAGATAGPRPAARLADPVAKAVSPKARAKVGHCIRCGDDVSFNAERPLCGGCYTAWAKYKNPEFKEKHCHSCGKERVTTFVKPLCKPCWEAGA